MQKMKDGGAIDSSCDGYRSICVNKATVDESTQRVTPVSLELTGVSAIHPMNPYLLQQAETMASSGGIGYEDFTNINKNTKISTLGNDASENMQVKMQTGSWIQLRSLDFGTTGAAKCTLRAKGEGTVEIRQSRIGAKAAATIQVSSGTMSDFTVDVDATKFQGKKSIYIVVTSGTDVCLDAWQFTKAQGDGIHDIAAAKPALRQRYNLQGRRLSDSQQPRGIVVEQYTDENGVSHHRKTVTRR